MTSDHTTTDPAPVTVYFDGSCPLCRREIALYQRANGAERVDWQDVSRPNGDRVAPDLTADDAMRRFHVRAEDGTLRSGAAAFATLWTALPGFRIFGRVAALPPVTLLLEGLYRMFLPLRSLLHRLIFRSAG